MRTEYEGLEKLLYLLAGLIIAWVIRKLFFEKKYVPQARYNELDQQLRLLQGEHAGAITRIDLLQKEKENASAEIARMRFNVEEKAQELQAVRIEIADYQAKIRYQQQQQEAHKQELEGMGEQLRKDFQLLATSILEEKTKKFTQLNADNLKSILDPLHLHIKEFKSKVEETYDKESKERFSLGEKIKDLVELNQRISDEANNLTRALKGDSKKQGDWGEMILESVLESSGLMRGREYFVQDFIRDEAGNVIKNESGQGMRPDVVVYYPDKRCLVIDSKVSLTAYERFANADEKEVQEKELGNHLVSLRAHIDNLSSKNYQHYVDSLDWVVMFVPVEPAYLVALRRDSGLWHYAYQKKIIMVCPSNLMAVLKITADLWKRESQSQHALAIAERGGRMYDKFVGFVESMQELGSTLDKAGRTYESAFRQLKEGPGNLVRQAEQMRQLGIKAAKQLPGTLVNEDKGEEE